MVKQSLPQSDTGNKDAIKVREDAPDKKVKNDCGHGGFYYLSISFSFWLIYQ
jgi:hypothetical protein